MIAYFLEIPNPKKSFFYCLSKSQKCKFERIHQIFTSPNNLTNFTYNRCIDVEVHCAAIEYKNGKVKPSYYPIRLTDLEES